MFSDENEPPLHLLILGIVDFEVLSRILTEAYSPTHKFMSGAQLPFYRDQDEVPDDSVTDLLVVILSPLPPSPQVSQVLNLPQFYKRLVSQISYVACITLCIIGFTTLREAPRVSTT